jgi:hypothetical protein
MPAFALCASAWQPAGISAWQASLSASPQAGLPSRSAEREGWWARQDSNLQPDRYERSALTIELQARPGRAGATYALFRPWELAREPAPETGQSSRLRGVSPRSAAAPTSWDRRPAGRQSPLCGEFTIQQCSDEPRENLPNDSSGLRKRIGNLRASYPTPLRAAAQCALRPEHFLAQTGLDPRRSPSRGSRRWCAWPR